MYKRQVDDSPFLGLIADGVHFVGVFRCGAAGGVLSLSLIHISKESDIVSGSVFAPNDPCTRELSVEFMWKYAGSPDAPDAAFTDISSAAVDWALDAGVTTGTTDTTFTPDRTCTRAEIVTFLYRGFAQ